MIATAEVVIGCVELQPSLEFYERLGFELELIAPAEAPTTAIVSGHGLRLRFVVDSSRRTVDDGRTGIRLTVPAPQAVELGSSVVGPEGTVVDIVAGVDEPVLPPASPTFELTRFDPADFGTGRASMAYRDLLPSRQGGRYIASHIRIAEGGPVPDYVHHHAILFQLIYCRRGWVRVVYEDQGPPFALVPGDCVLQPPGIRHRVLEASDGLEVIEVSCPAIHDTRTDTELALPTVAFAPDRRFGGQRLVRHRAAEVDSTIGDAGFTVRDVGLAEATGGLVTLRVLTVERERTAALAAPLASDLYFLFVDRGHATVAGPDVASEPLGPGDAVALPAGGGHAVDDCSADLEVLELTVRHTTAPPERCRSGLVSDDSGRFDQDGHPPLVGHHPVERLPVVVGATGSAEDRSQEAG